MRRIWIAAAALLWVIVAVEAQADILHLKDGRSLWGKEVFEEGESVVLIRPGGNLTFPRGEVNRIERVRTSLPPHYSVPVAPAAPGVGLPVGPAIPAAPAPGVPPGAPPAGGPAPTAGAPAAPAGGPAPAPAPAGGTTELPPPPAPPAPGGGIPR